ncbi:phosphopyruvate hydratase [Gammaproteobacteria bacterium]|nr:phosphopyruvate hydratase [Gammaproteobacteria bacterium]
MYHLEQIDAFEVLDSRGLPTVMCQATLSGGQVGCAIVPSGASTGSREVCELRDGGKRHHGKGVLIAIEQVRGLIDQLVIDPEGTPEQWDQALIGQGHLPGNVTLALSMAAWRAVAKCQQQPLYQTFIKQENYVLPIPFLNILNGGAHAANAIAIQEFMIVPHGFDTFNQAMQCGAECYQMLKSLLIEKGHSTLVGDEGGFAPNIANEQLVMDLILMAIEQSGYRVGDQVSLALDIAANELVNDEGRYDLGYAQFDLDQWCEKIQYWCSHYPIISIEDPIHEADWPGWSSLTAALADRCQIVGDDLFATQSSFLMQGIEQKAGSAILIKPNQVGTVSGAIETIQLARQNNFPTMVSHRSGDSEDSFIADLAVGMKASQVKFGAPCRGERTAKYNRLLMIAHELKDQAGFASINNGS